MSQATNTRERSARLARLAAGHDADQIWALPAAEKDEVLASLHFVARLMVDVAELVRSTDAGE